MNRMLWMGLAVTLASPTLAQKQAPRLAENTPVVIVGEITSQPKDFVNEKKMQVAIGPEKTDFTLHMSDAKLMGYHGAKIEPNDLQSNMWVRAEGKVMDDPQRIMVSRLQVIGKDLPGLKKSAFYRTGFDQGYVSAVAGTRQTYPEMAGSVYSPAPMTIIGKVTSDTGALEATRKIQVDAAGNTWTVHVPKDAPIWDSKGEKISVHEIADGQWVRVHGWQTDDLRIRGARLENIGPEATYRESTYYRTDEPIGYVDRMPGAGVQFRPQRMSGVVTVVDPATGSFTLRDKAGVERRFFGDTLTIQSDGRPLELAMLRPGQEVTIEGTEIQF